LQNIVAVRNCSAAVPAAMFKAGKMPALRRLAAGAYVPQFGMYARVPGQKVKMVLAVIMLLPGHGAILHQ